MLKFGRAVAHMGVEERRDRRRRVVLARAMVVAPELPPFRAHVVDVSPTGLGLQCHVEVPVGQQVTISLQLPIADFARDICLIGEVCYCKRQAERHFRVGVQLTHVDEPMTEYINAFFP